MLAIIFTSPPPHNPPLYNTYPKPVSIRLAGMAHKATFGFDISMAYSILSIMAIIMKL